MTARRFMPDLLGPKAPTRPLLRITHRCRSLATTWRVQSTSLSDCLLQDRGTAGSRGFELVNLNWLSPRSRPQHQKLNSAPWSKIIFQTHG
jgi:hypothetical protein